MKGLLKFIAGCIALYAIQVFFNDFFGEGIVGVFLGVLALAIFSLPLSLMVWPIASIGKYIGLAMGSEKMKQDIAYWFRWRFYYAGLLVILLLPHLWMSHHLAPLKKEFDAICYKEKYSVNFTGDYNDGRPINEADFGGSLDNIVAMRSVVLAKYGYIPYFTGRWTYKPGYWPSHFMAYIAIPLPQSVYMWIVYETIDIFFDHEVTQKEKLELQQELDNAPF